MGAIRKHTSMGMYKKFEGVPFKLYVREFPTEHGTGVKLHDYLTKIQADSAADRLRSKGFLARVVESPFAGTKPWIIYIRKKD